MNQENGLLSVLFLFVFSFFRVFVIQFFVRNYRAGVICSGVSLVQGAEGAEAVGDGSSSAAEQGSGYEEGEALEWIES